MLFVCHVKSPASTLVLEMDRDLEKLRKIMQLSKRKYRCCRCCLFSPAACVLSLNDDDDDDGGGGGDGSGLCGQLAVGRRPQYELVRRYKDALKVNIKQCGIDHQAQACTDS